MLPRVAFEVSLEHSAPTIGHCVLCLAIDFNEILFLNNPVTEPLSFLRPRCLEEKPIYIDIF